MVKLKTILKLGAGFCLFALTSFLQAQTSNSCTKFTFQRTFVAPDMNGGLSMALCADSGYVVTGQHGSSGAGACDVYVYKRNKCGEIVFFNLYGTALTEGGKCIKQTSDGGFIVTGLSTDGVLLLKIDNLGNLQWTKLFSGWLGFYAQQTTDGGYVFVGKSGNGSSFLVKTDANGVTQWTRTYLNAGDAALGYVEQTTDGGYFMVGYSGNGFVAGFDVWCMKTDAAGNLQWSKLYGGPQDEGQDLSIAPTAFAPQGQQTADGGYVFCALANSFGAGMSDIWLVKLDPAGNVLWNNTYGGSAKEQPRSMRITKDKGFIIVGWTMSFGAGEQDVYLLKTDSVGTLTWSKTFGGAGREKGESVQQSPTDFGYYIDGYTGSFGADLFDPYTIKTDSTGDAGCNQSTPATIVGTGIPTVTNVTPGIDASSIFISNLTFTQNTYTPTEYSLCETVFPASIAHFINPAICPGVPTTFTDSSSGGCGPIVHWLWDFGDGSPLSTLQNPTHTFAAPGTYNVKLSVGTIYDCFPTDTIQPVIVYNNPIALFSDSASGCTPVCTIFHDSSQAISGNVVSWHWDFPGGTPPSSDDQNPSTCFTIPGTYDVSVIATNTYGCKDTLLKPQYVRVFEWPVANFSVSPYSASILDPTFNFYEQWSSDVVKWYWDFGNGTQVDSLNPNPSHNYLSTSTNNDWYNYKIGLKVKTVHGCWDTTSRMIEIIPEFTFYINNTFTPNGDYVNDVFYGKGIGVKKYEIMIFDRWGNLIWKCNHEGKNTDWDNWGQEGMPSACKWDGRANGGDLVAQIDTYVWKVQLTDIFNKKHNYIGIVNIVK